MIKLYLILLILIFLTILISKKEPFATCGKNVEKTGPLLINGGLIDDKIHIFWNKPVGLKVIEDTEDVEKITYDIIYSTNDSNVTNPVGVDSNNHIKRDIAITKRIDKANTKLFSTTMSIVPTLKDGEYYNITLNMNINDRPKDGADQTKQTLSSNTLVINKTNDNPMIRYLSNPNDIFANLKNKSIDIII